MSLPRKLLVMKYQSSSNPRSLSVTIKLRPKLAFKLKPTLLTQEYQVKEFKPHQRDDLHAHHMLHLSA